MKYSDLSKAQKKKLIVTMGMYLLIGIITLTAFCSVLLLEKEKSKQNWESYLSDSAEEQQIVEDLSKDAIVITAGSYVENIRELNIKASTFRVELKIWFTWEGDESLDPASNFRVYKGIINKTEMISEHHEGNRHYQLLSLDTTVSKSYKTKRFPLESHQMRVYVESNYPVQEAVFTPDHENSGINRNISLSGYEFLRNDIGVTSYIYDSNHGDPFLPDNAITSELVTAFEINRSGFGLYFRCFVALIGTMTWVLITMFLCTYHHVDPIGMVPAALFGTVSNIMVGANLLPDALELGLVEFVNLWGVMIIVSVAIAIINMNRIRSKGQDKEFAKYFGRRLFVIVLSFVLIGSTIMPICAYRFS